MHGLMNGCRQSQCFGKEKRECDLIRREDEMGHGTVPVSVFYPTIEQAKDFERLIQLIEETGAHHKCGICKIVPPRGWNPRPSKAKMKYKDVDTTFIQTPVFEEYAKTGDGIFRKIMGNYKKKMAVKEFRKIAEDRSHKAPDMNAEDLDELMMDQLLEGEEQSTLYGADSPGSLFDSDLDDLNMSKNHLLLNKLGTQIKGVNTMYLYYGMYKSGFAWHTEDVDLYSINYLHYGAEKHWYAVPPDSSDRFERLLGHCFPMERKKCSSFTRHKEFLVVPSVLKEHGIPFGTMVQKKNEFIITFPRGYHMGFNTGYNIAEATNFATNRWIDFGKNATTCECRGDSVRIDMLSFMEQYRTEEFPIWYSYWYTEKRQIQRRGKRKAVSPVSDEDPYICDRKEHLRKTMGNMFSYQKPNLDIEIAYNKERALLFPHCSLCQSFLPERCLVRSADNTPPQRSLRIVRNIFFAKGDEDNPLLTEMEDPDEDDLLTCVNCKVTTHVCCYAHPSSLTLQPSSVFLCLRCQQKDKSRLSVIACTSCCLCELRGGPLIHWKMGLERAYVHIVCAIMNRRTYFDDIRVRSLAVTIPPKKHGYRDGYQMTSKLNQEYIELRGEWAEAAKYVCDLCGNQAEGLVQCEACCDFSSELLNAKPLVHATCGRSAGFSLEYRSLPLGPILYCGNHIEGAIRSGDGVIVNTSGGEKRGVVVESEQKACNKVTFFDNTESTDLQADDIVWCGCPSPCNGQHVHNAPVRVVWNDNKVYGGYFRETADAPEYNVLLDEGVTLAVSSRDLRPEVGHPIKTYSKSRRL